MKLQHKLSLAFGLFFVSVLVLAALGAFSIHRLNKATQVILVDNYESLDYVQEMFRSLDTDSMAVFAYFLDKQLQNITEPNEGEVTQSVADAFHALPTGDSTAKKALDAQIRSGLHQILDINQSAIVSKSEKAHKSGEAAYQLIAVLSTVMVLLLFTFLLNLPGYISRPLTDLRDGIRQIMQQDYSARLEVRSKDELGELSSAFNDMAQKLDFWEHSNWAKVLFEKKRIEAIVDGMQDAIIGIDELQNVLFVNPVMEKLLGVHAEGLIEKNALELALKNDLLRQLLRADTKGELNIVLEGKECWFKPEILDVGSGSHPLGKVIVLKNVTPYRALDEAKTNFIATISHELKTPIAAMQMSMRLLDDDRVGKLNTEQKLLVQQMRSDHARLQRITGELLDLAQVESGQLRLSLTLTPVQDLINYSTAAVEAALRDKNCHVDVTVDPDLPSLRIDPEKTAWVLVNLLNNAIKYSPEHSTIQLKVQKKGQFLAFSVKDEGAGIDAQYVDKIFDKFFRVPVGKSNATEGAGMGLAIAREFIEAQGGQIYVHSEAGKGTEFTFQLPFSDVEQIA